MQATSTTQQQQQETEAERARQLLRKVSIDLQVYAQSLDAILNKEATIRSQKGQTPTKKRTLAELKTMSTEAEAAAMGRTDREGEEVKLDETLDPMNEFKRVLSSKNEYEELIKKLKSDNYVLGRKVKQMDGKLAFQDIALESHRKAIERLEKTNKKLQLESNNVRQQNFNLRSQLNLNSAVPTPPPAAPIPPPQQPQQQQHPFSLFGPILNQSTNLIYPEKMEMEMEMKQQQQPQQKEKRREEDIEADQEEGQIEVLSTETTTTFMLPSEEGIDYFYTTKQTKTE